MTNRSGHVPHFCKTVMVRKKSRKRKRQEDGSRNLVDVALASVTAASTKPETGVASMHQI